MVFGVYIRGNIAYVPTVARTDVGFYIDVEPFEVVPLADTDGFVNALKNSIARGNPAVPTPLRHEYKKPLVLKYAGVKSQREFERTAGYWSLSEENGVWRFGPYKNRDDRGWEEDPPRLKQLHPDESLEQMLEQVVKAIQQSVEPSVQ